MAIDFPSAPTTGQLWPSPAVVGQPQYIWDGQKWTTQGVPPRQPVYADGSVPMNAQLTLVGDPTHPTDAADKHYVDNYIASASMLAKNYIINGAMQVSQENGATVGSTTSYYAVDQFALAFVNASASAAQVASVTPGGSPNRLRVTVTAAHTTVAASDYLTIQQRIEGLRTADLRFGSASAKAITLQFGVKAPAGVYCVSILNGAVNRTYVAEYTITAGQANTDTIVAITIPGDVVGTWATDNTVGFILSWGMMVGTTYQQAAGAWTGNLALSSPNQFNMCATNGNVFELFDVGLYQGSAAPPFQVPDYVTELVKCQRYFETGGQPQKFFPFAAGNTSFYDIVFFKVTKRVTATVTLSGWQYYNAGGSAVAYTPTVNGAVDWFAAVGTGLTSVAGWAPTGTWKASARL